MNLLMPMALLGVNISINGETDMNVYLGEGTEISANTVGAKNDQAVLGSRMAVVVGGVAKVHLRSRFRYDI